MPSKKTNPRKSAKTGGAPPATLSASPIAAVDQAAVTSTSTSGATSTAPNAGLGALVGEITDFLDRAEARLGPEAPSLTGPQKKRKAKPRKGAEKILAMLAPIVQQHQLDSANLSSKAMLTRLETASTLRPLQVRLQKLQKRVGDEAFNAQGDAWTMGLQFYSLVRSRAKTDGQVAASIEPLKAMFGYRHPDVKAAKPKKAQTRAKKGLKNALELATKHGVAAGVLAAEAAPLTQAGATAAVTAAVMPVTPTATVAAAPVVSVPSGTGAQAVQSTPVASVSPAATTANPGAATTAIGNAGSAPIATPIANGAAGVSHA